MNWLTSKALLLSLCCWAWTNAAVIKSLGSFSLKYPGFITLFRNTTSTNGVTFDLLVSSFDPVPFSTDGAYIVYDIGSSLGKLPSIRPTLITSSVTWPNEVQQVPDAVFGRSVITIASGFLVPFKTDGSIQLVDVTAHPFRPYKVTKKDSKQWFFHKVQWVDMDKDGDLDILTCRARKPIFGSSEGQLLWLENPDNHGMEDPWKQHILADGPDIFFHHTILNNSGTPTEFIFTSGYFSKALSVYYLTSGNTWSNSSTVNGRTIDSKIGSVFDVEVEDVDQDGSPELMVTTNNENQDKGSIHFYTIPSDVKNGVYQRHDIEQVYEPRKSGVGKGAPGAAFVIPSKNRSKPLDILLSGDDDGRAYILTAPKSFAYQSKAFADVGDGTVGQLAFEDVDGDGTLEIFVPDYNNGKIWVYSYQE